jgi:hypothetical protein
MTLNTITQKALEENLCGLKIKCIEVEYKGWNGDVIKQHSTPRQYTGQFKVPEKDYISKKEYVGTITGVKFDVSEGFYNMADFVLQINGKHSLYVMDAGIYIDVVT